MNVLHRTRYLHLSHTCKCDPYSLAQKHKSSSAYSLCDVSQKSVELQLANSSVDVSFQLVDAGLRHQQQDDSAAPGRK